MLENGHIEHQIISRVAHGKIRTAKVIYDAIMSILSFLRHVTKSPKIIKHFNSGIYQMVNEVWEEQQAIGWDQILKRQLNSR